MSQATIRTAIYNVVNGVSGTGNVYDYRRWAVLYDQVLSMFKDRDTSSILGFDVEAGPMSDERVEFRTTGDRGILRTWTFRIRMYYGANDADETEKAAATLLESVADALNSAATLHDGQTFYDAGLASASILELRTFAGNLVHYAQIDQTVTEFLT